MSDTEAVVILMTGPDAEVLGALAHYLVQERLVACVNVVDGVRSVYRWRGRVEDATEALAILKTTRDRVAALREQVLEMHPYDVPEFLVLPVREGASAYLEWIDESVR